MRPGSDELLLGIDLGSGGVKVVLMTGRNGIRRRAQRWFCTQRPRPGFSEQNPSDWFKAVAECCREVLDGGIRPAAVGISGAAHIPVFLDGTMQPVRPSILWNDTRSAAVAADLARTHGDEILALTCNAPSPAWTLPMLMWLAQHEPETLARTRHFLLGKDVLVHRLTNVLIADAGNAVSSMLADAHHMRWAPQLQEMAGLDAAAYPEIVDPSQIVGQVTDAAAAEFGIPPGTPVIAGLLDSLAELIALGAIEPGNSMVRLGTAGGVMSVTREPLNDHRLITYPFISGYWASQAFTSSCASAISWFRGVLAPQLPDPEPGRASPDALTFEALDELAASVAPGASGLLFQPYLAGERAPHWDASLRAGFVGAGFEHGREHFMRAVLEGIGCSIADCRDLVHSIGGDTGVLRATGGGTRSPVLMGIVSNILNSSLSLGPAEGSAAGVAALAGTSVGVFSQLSDALSGLGAPGRTVDPTPHEAGTYAGVLDRYRGLSGALNPFYQTHPYEPVQRA